MYTHTHSYIIHHTFIHEAQDSDSGMNIWEVTPILPPNLKYLLVHVSTQESYLPDVHP